uniref:RTA1-domain-containing protein n=1 Tax=Psilocybe cubensis TaxID=181762 RepID=A0A8H7XYP2_PSICU
MSLTGNGTVVDHIDGNDSDNPYGYVPSRTVAIIFLSLFTASTVIHGWQASHYRKWWLLYTACLCGVIELAGWSGRLWSSFSPLLDSPFQMQITCTIIAPTPLLAASFIIFGDIIKILGPMYSRLNPRLYTIIFTSCDVVSLVVQGVGGGLAASSDGPDGAEMAIIILVFCACAIEFGYRYTYGIPFPAGIRSPRNIFRTGHSIGRGDLTIRIQLMCYALVFSTTVLFIRAIYRIIELTDGWNGRIIQTELYFNVLDGAMVVLAIYTLNIFHPGMMLSEQFVSEKGGSEMERLETQ